MPKVNSLKPMNPTQHITYNFDLTIKDKIATISFGYAASNALPRALLTQLATTINQLKANSEVKVLVLKSRGESTFCAGASFDELLLVTNQDEAKAFFTGFAEVLNAMRTCSKIIIGRIQGKAVGGGVGIVAACDYAFATNQSAIKLSELAIGIGPFVIEPALSRKIGKAALAEMTLDTEWKTASWAHQKGLFNKILENTTQLDSEVATFASKISHYSPEALFEIKKIFWEGTENWAELLYERAEISGRLVLSDFTKQALLQFKKGSSK